MTEKNKIIILVRFYSFVIAEAKYAFGVNELMRSGVRTCECARVLSCTFSWGP